MLSQRRSLLHVVGNLVMEGGAGFHDSVLIPEY